MQNDLKYTVRSREIVDLVQAMRTDRLTLSPYFQRNLVWRDAHKRDFIETILKGYPFPQIFLARGPINLDTMEASQCVVDGQQRLNAIRDFINGKLDVANRHFVDMPAKEREYFLKYEVAVIDFDLDAGDDRLKEVFRRLNRTYYSLSAIERIASEFSASEFLLVARVLSGEITNASDEDDELGEIGSEDASIEPIPSNPFSRDPGIEESTWAWLLSRADGAYARVLKQHNIFTPFEFDRKVPLMFTLNVICTYLTGYYNRNDRVRKYLEDCATEFAERDEAIDALNASAQIIDQMELPASSMWWSKANFFTLVAELSRFDGRNRIDTEKTATNLTAFASVVPPDYALAAREAVGRKGQRDLRGCAVRQLLASQA